jgi:hypothetical protein
MVELARARNNNRAGRWMFQTGKPLTKFRNLRLVQKVEETICD